MQFTQCQNFPPFSEHCIMGYSTRSQGLPAFKIQDGGSFLACSNSTKELAFLEIFTQCRDLPNAGKSSKIIGRSQCIVIPSYFATTELQNIYLFLRRMKLMHEDMKHNLWPSLISTLLVFIIMILYHQVFKRNQQLDTKLYESLKFQQHSGNYFCKGKRNSRCTSSASAIDNAICI